MSNYIYTKLNELLNKSTNLYAKFLMTLIIVLSPFVLISLFISVSIYNPLRGIVLALVFCSLVSEKTRGNKYVLAVIGIIPVAYNTSSIISEQVNNHLTGFLFSNSIKTIIGGVSIYIILSALKEGSSLYEWFMNTGFGGHFFPQYKDLKQQLELKNQTIKKLVLTLQESIKQETKVTTDLAKSTTLLQAQNNIIEETAQHPIINNTKETYKISANKSKQYFVTIPVDSKVKSVAELYDNLKDAYDLSQEQIVENKNQIKEHYKITKELTDQIKQTQQTEISPPSSISMDDAMASALNRLLVGGLILIGSDLVIKIIVDNHYLVQTYNALKSFVGLPLTGYLASITTYIVGDVTVTSFNSKNEKEILPESALNDEVSELFSTSKLANDIIKQIEDKKK